jgi:hypothetical protein
MWICDLELWAMDSETIIGLLKWTMANHPTLTKLMLSHLDWWSAMAVRNVLDSSKSTGGAKLFPIIQGFIINHTVHHQSHHPSLDHSSLPELLPALLKSNITILTHLELTNWSRHCSSDNIYHAILAALKGFLAAGEQWDSRLAWHGYALPLSIRWYPGQARFGGWRFERGREAGNLSPG